MKKLERQLLLDRARLDQYPSVMELLAIRHRAVRSLRADLRTERDPVKRKEISDTLLESRRQWRELQELVRDQLARKMREAKLYLDQEEELH